MIEKMLVERARSDIDSSKLVLLTFLIQTGKLFKRKRLKSVCETKAKYVKSMHETTTGICFARAILSVSFTIAQCRHFVHYLYKQLGVQKSSCSPLRFTDSTKINRPGYNIRMYWTNFWQSSVHVHQNIFERTLVEVFNSHLYASFGTFCAQIGQLFET